MRAAAEIRRPALRYHGGKWRLAPWRPRIESIWLNPRCAEARPQQVLEL